MANFDLELFEKILEFFENPEKTPLYYIQAENYPLQIIKVKIT